MLTHVSLRVRFTDHDEEIVPLESAHEKLCCRPVLDLVTWLDAEPGHNVRFADGTVRTIASVGIFRCLPPIAGTRAGIEPTFPTSAREVIAGAEEGRLVDWNQQPPRWRIESAG